MNLKTGDKVTLTGEVRYLCDSDDTVGVHIGGAFTITVPRAALAGSGASGAQRCSCKAEPGYRHLESCPLYGTVAPAGHAELSEVRDLLHGALSCPCKWCSECIDKVDAALGKTAALLRASQAGSKVEEGGSNAEST